MSICVKCPVCNELFHNEILYYDHITEKTDDQHAIYKKQLTDLIKKNLDKDMYRKEIMRLLTRDGYIVTENEIFDIEIEHYPNKGICNFYGIPYEEYLSIPTTNYYTRPLDNYISEKKEELNDVFSKVLNYLLNTSNEGAIESKLINERGKPTNLLVSYMLKPADKNHIIYNANNYRAKQVITKEFKFDACHNLLGYTGKCRYPHGHTYILRVSIKNSPSYDHSMVMDFGVLNEIVKEKIINKLDHKNLNEVLDGINTTAEDIILWIWKNLDYRSTYNGLYGLHKIELWETPTSKVKLMSEQMMNDNFYLLSLYQLYNIKIKRSKYI